MILTFEQQKHLWERIKPIEKLDDCWIWFGTKDKDGYGKIKINRKTLRAHRVIFSLFHDGMDLQPNQLLCHTCDNPSCVNPNHLFIGTEQDNSNDMVKKGRSVRGEQSPFSKLQKDDILQIFDMFINQKMTPTSISKFYNVSETCIRLVLERKSWRFVELPFEFDINNYKQISKENKSQSIDTGKRVCFRKKFKDDPEIYNKISVMLKTSTKTDVANFFDINMRTLTRLIKKGKV